MTNLYRHYDSSDKLLYVGISVSAVNRLKEHIDSSKWTSDISTVKIESFPDRNSALLAEKLAIKTEKPIWNIIHNREEKKKIEKKEKSIEKHDIFDTFDFSKHNEEQLEIQKSFHTYMRTIHADSKITVSGSYLAMMFDKEHVNSLIEWTKKLSCIRLYSGNQYSRMYSIYSSELVSTQEDEYAYAKIFSRPIGKSELDRVKIVANVEIYQQLLNFDEELLKFISEYVLPRSMTS
jgi:hypothetical protein